MVLHKYQKYQETEEEFMERSYWNEKTDKVLVFHSKFGKDDPNIPPKEIWTVDKAREYIESLQELNYSH